jgi:hypothetical protein
MKFRLFRTTFRARHEEKSFRMLAIVLGIGTGFYIFNDLLKRRAQVRDSDQK